MIDSPLCWQITLSAEECERSMLGVVLFARGMGLALGVFGAWLALLQPGMTCQGGKHDVKYSYYHM